MTAILLLLFAPLLLAAFFATKWTREIRALRNDMRKRNAAHRVALEASAEALIVDLGTAIEVDVRNKFCLPCAGKVVAAIQKRREARN